MMMGAFGGAVDDLLLHPDNPLKFWERRDVVALDEQRLVEGVEEKAALRYEVPEWVAYGFDGTKPAVRIHETSGGQNIVAKLNVRRPWVTKDPRMCLVADEWMPLLDAPACIIVHREPLSVANSMMIYSHNVSLAEWASVYETYYTSALRACHGKPTVVVQHADLVADPYAAVRKLHADLTDAGVAGLTLPSEGSVTRLIRPSTEKVPLYLRSERQAVGAAAQRISDALSMSSLPAHPPAPASWLIAPRKTDEAFATLLTTENVDDLRGALVLGSSIRTFDSSRDMVALVTDKVPAEWQSSLTVAGWTVLVVPELEEFWWGRSSECSHFAVDQGERWGHMATKLRLWELTQYKRVLYLDADTILTGPASPAFESVTTFAAEAPKYHAHFNAGVLLLSPSKVVFHELLSLGRQPHGSRFGNLIDCTEQGLLNTYFNGQPGREVTKLPIGRADVKADWAAEGAPFAVHWITHVCPKPWRVADRIEEMESHCDADIYAYWRRVWDRLTASSKDESTAASVGSREAARRKMRRLTGVSAGPSLVGRVPAPALPPVPMSVGALWGEIRDGLGRQLRQVMHHRELRRRRYEYDAPWSEGTWAWIAIIGTLALGLAAGALLHKLFIKTPTEVGKGMTVVQAKRMGFQALGEGRGPVGVVSAVDDDEEEDDEEPPPKKGGKK
jgi:glycogenin glucosyltransferase